MFYVTPFGPARETCGASQGFSVSGKLGGGHHDGRSSQWESSGSGGI